MALTQQELDRLKGLITERQNPDLSKFKEGAMDRVSGTIKKAGEGVYEAIKGEGEYEGRSKVRRLFDAGAQAFNAVPKVALDVMPEPVRKTVGKVGEVIGEGFSAVTNKIGDIPQFQKWTQEHPKAAKALEEITGTLSSAGQIAGDITLARQGTNVLQKGAGAIKSKAPKIVGGGGGGDKGIGRVIDSVYNGSKTKKLGDTKIINKAQDIITPVDKGVKTVLTKSTTPKVELKAKFKSYTEQAKKALEDYSQKTPLEMAGEKAQSALNTLQAQLKKTGEAKSAATQKISGTRIEVRPFVKDLVEQAKTKLNLTPTKKGFVEAQGKISKVSDKADIKMVNDVARTLSKAKTFKQLDDAIDYAQDLLFKRKSLTAVPVNSQVQGILKSVIKKANDKLKEIGGKDYKSLNVKYSNRIQVYEKLNKALGAEGNKGAALMKQLFSPSGTASRKLFAAVKKFTGTDLVEEATLAKFVMENIGDVRQASLLEQVIRGQATTKSGLIGIATEKLMQKLQDPIGKAERLIGGKSN